MMAGRLSGTFGQKLAAIYIQEQFENTIIETFEFYDVEHGGWLASGKDTLKHQQDFFYLGFYEQTKLNFDTFWSLKVFSAEQLLAQETTDFDDQTIVLVKDWQEFIELFGHLFSKNEQILKSSVEQRKIIFIRAEKINDLYHFGGELVLSSNLVHTENIFIPLVFDENNNRNLILSAHYDHLGQDELGIFSGADDNASGVAMLLTMQQTIIKNFAEKGVNIFLLFCSAEEQGLLGSQFHVSQNHYATTQTTVVNFDMVGFAQQENPRVYLVVYDEKPETSQTYFSNETQIDQVHESFFLHEFSSDHQPFFEDGYKSYLFFSGLHYTYHTIEDLPSILNYDAMNDLLIFVVDWLEDKND